MVALRQRFERIRREEDRLPTYDGSVEPHLDRPQLPQPGASRRQQLIHEADALHRLLILRADNLEGCTEGSEEEGELGIIAAALEAYEAKRWPDGAVPGGKAE